LAAYFGLAVSVITCIASFSYIFLRIFFGVDWPAGFATTTVLLLFGISLNGIFLGIIGEYVGRIYNQVRWRPTAVVERSVNIVLEPPSGRSGQSAIRRAWPATPTIVQNRSGLQEDGGMGK